jgi:hypothetical protein
MLPLVLARAAFKNIDFTKGLGSLVRLAITFILKTLNFRQSGPGLVRSSAKSIEGS